MITTVSLIPQHQNLLPRPCFHKGRSPSYSSPPTTLDRQYNHQSRHHFGSEVSHATPAIFPYQYDLITVFLFNWNCHFTSAVVRSITLDSKHQLAPCSRLNCTLTLTSLLICHSCSAVSMPFSTCVSIGSHAMAWLQHPPWLRCRIRHNMRFEGCFQRPIFIPFQSSHSTHSMAYKQSTTCGDLHGKLVTPRGNEH